MEEAFKDISLRYISIINYDGSTIPIQVDNNGRHLSHLEILTGKKLNEMPSDFDPYAFQMEMLMKGMIRVIIESGNSFNLTFAVKPSKPQMDIIRRMEEHLQSTGGQLKFSILSQTKPEFFYVSDGNWVNTVS